MRKLALVVALKQALNSLKKPDVKKPILPVFVLDADSGTKDDGFERIELYALKSPSGRGVCVMVSVKK